MDLSTDDRKLVTQPYDLGVKGISDDIARGRLKLAIEYQRKYVWDQSKASRLIESLLLNVPIPVCYFAEDEDGSYEVIDGLQRLTTISRFLKNKFSLSGISVLKELEGKFYDDLAPRDQRRLENRTIRCIVITEESHPDIKFDVFERLNTGAASLTAQELRNCIYRGEFNDSLKSMAKNRSLLRLLGSDSNSRMDHEELVLRFLALTSGVELYKPPLRQFLNSHIRKNRHRATTSRELKMFESTCDAVYEALGDGAFRVVGRDGKAHRNVNKALFDSIMIPAAFADKKALVRKSAKIREIREELLRDEDFLTSIGRATADKTRMHLRVGKFAEALRSIGIDVNLPDLSG
ncbi:hypothetical protein RAM_40670 [Amycolatopsis mediterranei S699]|uniref:GmrSD restriction endonucleases N-terminal domain-containing protein n=1 Tax=Amycolatopsis mediterranei (strain S699) TaxID=713604 RepID=A0A9R0UD65_AMYMS|nr:hypothetical protein RAM_40670 [Amycolatopsis mediterranei S699]